MEIVKALLSFLSYVYHGLLCLIVLALTSLAVASGAKSLELGMLPWTETTLLYVLFFGALFGLLTIFLAIKGTLRPLFFVWSLAVMLLLIKGYIFSSYHFAPGEFRTAIYLIVGSIIGVLGAWARMSRRSAR
ncbi:MAG: hypothetical protein ABI806_17030 [Candidatus Solibacter sp.]